MKPDLNIKISELKMKFPVLYKVVLFCTIGFSLAILSILIFYFAVLFGAFGQIPDKAELADIRNYNASEVYSADYQLMGKYFVENRTNVAYEDISPYVIDALVATEDARFYLHQGIDNRSMLRVLIKSIILNNETAGGGSTISQQLAKNLFQRKYNYSFLSLPVNKVREVIIARKLEKIYTKEQILTLYLNTVPFGGGAFGIETASRSFFDKSPAELNIQEAATLVGMLKANTTFNPRINPENAFQRRNIVIHQMVKYDYLDMQKADSISGKPIELKVRSFSHNEGPATYLRENIRLELQAHLRNINKPDGSPYNLYTDGLKIHTTIDSRMQKYAEDAVSEQMSHLQKQFDDHWRNLDLFGGNNNNILARAIQNSDRFKQMKSQGYSEIDIEEAFNTPAKMTIWDWEGGERMEEITPLDSLRHYLAMLNTGFVAMDPHTGHIKAWVGGVNHKYFKYDHVRAKRQVGSTFKPILYAAALEQGAQPCDYYSNEQQTYAEYQDWTPRNADHNYGGYYSMEGALTKSVNVVSVNMIMETGIIPVVNLAHRMGIQSDIPILPSIALGASEISLMEMIEAYAVFAARGRHTQPQYILKVEDKEGNVILDFTSTSRQSQVLRPETADMINHMMQGAVNNGTGSRLRSRFQIMHPVAGKTGTTQSNSDGWFIGYTPNLVAGAWVGGAERSIRFRSLSLGQGANTALPIWGRFMAKVNHDPELRSEAFGDFVPPIDSMNCAPYLEKLEEPSLWEVLFRKEERKRPQPRQKKENLWDRVRGVFRGDR